MNITPNRHHAHRILQTAWLLCALGSPAAWAGNYATCILDKMPGTQTEAVYYATNILCLEKHPGWFYEIEKGSGRGLFSFNSRAECTADKAKYTRFEDAAYRIGFACACLYDKASTKGERCVNPVTGALTQGYPPVSNKVLSDWLESSKAK